jgi:hypothetical protein
MTADDHGDLYVGGESNSYPEAIVSKIGRDGNLIWSKYVNGNNIEGWQFDGVAYHDGQVATLVQVSYNRPHSYYKMSVMDSDTGDLISTTDIHDPDGDLRAASMMYHSTLGWTIVGQTYGEFGTTSSMTDTNNPKDYIDWIRLPGDSTIVDGQYPSNYNGWEITGTGITGTQYLNGGVGYYPNCPVTAVSGSGQNATVNVTVDYNGGGYYNIDYISVGGINYANSDVLKVAGSVFGGIDGGTNITATPTAITVNSSNAVEVTFTKAGYPNLYNQIKWSSWIAQYNASSYTVLAIVSSGSNWVVTLDTTDTNGGTPPTITFYTLYGNDFLFTCGSDGSLTSSYGYNGSVSRAYIDINMNQMGYNGSNFRANVTKNSGTGFTLGDYKIWSDGVSSYFVLADDAVDPAGVKTWFRTGDLIYVTDDGSLNQVEITPVGQYGSVSGTPYSGWLLAQSFGGGDPYQSNITVVTYPGAPGTFTLRKGRGSRAWVWNSSWTRYLNTMPDINNAYPSSRGKCITEDPNDQSIVVGGSIDNPTPSGNALVWKLSKTGTTLWAKTINNDSNSVRGLAISPSTSEIYVANQATALTKIASGGGSITGRVHPTGMWGMYDPEVYIQVEDDGLEYVYVGGKGSAIWQGNSGFYVNKLTSDLQTVWGRWMAHNNNSLNTDYDIDHTKFVVANGQASIAGYGYLYSSNYNNALIYTMSTQNHFDKYNNNGWTVQQRDEQVWGTDNDSYTLFDLLAAGASVLTATVQSETDTANLTWNNWTFQSRRLNFNVKQQGIKGIETIEFTDGGVLDHNPSDIPPSEFFDPSNTSWSYTLQMSDRGRFILNQTVPNYTYCQNLYLYVPRNDDVPFPVGTVITIINASESNYRIYVEPVNYNDQECAKIWAAGTGNQNSSTWSFLGMQTATLMKISTNAWILTANNVTNED